MNASYGVKKPKKLSGQMSSEASGGTGDGKKENSDSQNKNKDTNSPVKSEDSRDTA
jgi:hypothetical protein